MTIRTRKTSIRLVEYTQAWHGGSLLSLNTGFESLTAVAQREILLPGGDPELIFPFRLKHEKEMLPTPNKGTNVLPRWTAPSALNTPTAAPLGDNEYLKFVKELVDLDKR